MYPTTVDSTAVKKFPTIDCFILVKTFGEDKKSAVPLVDTAGAIGQTAGANTQCFILWCKVFDTCGGWNI